MHPAGLEGFVTSTPDLVAQITNPSLRIGNLSLDFQKVLFWPRNRILHLGYSRYGLEEARRSLNVAELAINIIKRLDEKKRYSLPP